MGASGVVRAARASVFAALCVLLSAFGHRMMSGHPVPWPALAGAFVATGLGAWLFARHERGSVAVITGTLVTQGLLHTVFSLAGPRTAPESATSARQWADRLLCGTSSTDAMSEGQAAELLHHAGLGHLAAVAPSHGGGQPAGMVAAHVLAAVVSAVWLWGGERAVFSLSRAAVRRVLATVLWVAGPCPVAAPNARSWRPAESDRTPRLALLVRVVPSRGPPVALAVV